VRIPLTSRRPEEIVAFRGGEGVSIETLLAESAVLARSLPRARHAINLHANRYQYLRGFCAAMLTGHCTLMPPNRQSETLAKLERAYPACYRLGDGAALTHPDEKVGDPAAAEPSLEIEDGQAAIIAFTSGSTGEAAPTLKSWHTLRIGTANNHHSLLESPDEQVNVLATVPPQHMWGFETSILLPLLAPVAISEKNPLYPADIAEGLAELPEPRLLVSSPLHLRTLMQSGVETPPLLRILTATAPLSAEDAIALESHFQAEVLDVFGCSESGVFARRRTAREADWSLTPPFRLEASHTETLIHAEHLPEAVSLPDRVEIVGERRFRWLGRQQDLINIAGKRGSLADLNRRLLQIEGVLDGIVFQPQDESRLAALVVAPGLAAADIAQTLRPQVDPVFVPRPIYLLDRLPRQETGKIARSDLLELFRSAHGSQ